MTGGPYSRTLTTVSVAHSSETIPRMDFGLVAFFKAWDFSLASNFVLQTVSLCPESFLIVVISSFSFFPDGCILLHKNSSIGLESFISGLTFAVIIIMHRCLSVCRYPVCQRRDVADNARKSRIWQLASGHNCSQSEECM